MQGGAPSPLHEFVDTWHNKYGKTKYPFISSGVYQIYATRTGKGNYK